MRRRGICVAGLMCILIASCKKNVDQNISVVPDDPGTPAVNERAELNREMAKLIEGVYQDPNAFYEVNAAVASEHYEDETVPLKDLLFPEYSELYKSDAFVKSGAVKGTFKKRFYEELGRNAYPEIRRALYHGNVNREIVQSINAVSPATDTSAEIFSNSNGVAIYFPYSENFGTLFNSAYFDNINKDPRGKLATIVAADRDADSGPGREPYIGGEYRTTMKIMYTNVTVNDSYAESNPTHIVGVKPEPRKTLMGADTVPVGGSLRVYHGVSVLKRNLDRLISFTGNGGGSEMKVCRISGYLQMKDQQVTSYASDLITIHYKRKDVRKQRAKYVMGIWDPNWKKDNFEQVYAVWEDDNQGTKKFNGSLKTTLKLSSMLTGVADIGFDVSISTQDEIVTQRKIDRQSYLTYAKVQQGCGVLFLPIFGVNWPWYDCGTIWQYTWPYRII